ncbi:MAG: hypothetical protein QXL18_03225 [Candidatus Woesearchaeota archaeon]
MKMIENIIFLGKEKPLPDRYLNYNLIKELDNLVFENKCKNNEHNIVFAKYEVNNNSSFFDDTRNLQLRTILEKTCKP